MAKVKGIVAKVDGKSSILITSQGEFVRVRSNGNPAAVGQEIEAPRLSPPTWRKTALAVAAVLILSLVVPFYPLLTASAQPAAYVSLDINPSVELGINRQGNVVESKAFNQAGSKLLTGSAVAKTNIYQALQILLKQAVQDGFITKGQPNLLVVSFTGDGRYTFDQQRLNALIEQQMTKADVQTQVVLTPATMTTHQQALAKQMSQGKYLVMQAAKAKGVDLDLNKLINSGIDQALEAKGIDLQEIEPHVTQMGAPDKAKAAKHPEVTPKIEEQPHYQPSHEQVKENKHDSKDLKNKPESAKPEHQGEATMSRAKDSAEKNMSGSTVNDRSSAERDREEQQDH